MSAANTPMKPAVEPQERVSVSARASGHWLTTPASTRLLGISIGPDVYLRNAYRVLGLPANASPETTARASGRLKSMAKLNGAAVQRLCIRNGYELHISSEDALQAVAHLKDPRRRLVNELFWPHLVDGFEARLTLTRSLDDAQLRSDLQAAADQKNGRVGALAKHSLAVLYHNLALRDELQATDGLSSWSDQYWCRALSMWGDTLASKHFWDYMTERVRSYDDPRVRPEDLSELRAQLWRVLLEFNALLARSHAESNAPLSNGHLVIISKAPCPSETMVSVLGASIKAIANKKLVPLIEMARSELLGHKTKPTWQNFRQRCDPILQLADEVMEFLCKEIQVSEEVASLAEFDGLCDAISAGLSQSIDYAQDRERAILYSMVTTRRLLGFPLSPAGRIKHESTLRQDRQHLYKDFDLPEDVDPAGCWFLSGELADPEASIIKPVFKLTKLTATSIQWNSRKILVPRSRLVQELHRGRKPPAGFKSRASAPAAVALSQELDGVRANTEKAARDLEAQRDVVRRRVQEQHAAKLDQAQMEIDRAQAQIAPQVAAAEGERDKEIAKERGRLDAQFKEIRSRHADKLAEAEKLLEEIKAGKPDKGTSRILPISLGLMGTVVGVASAYQLDFWHLLPRLLSIHAAIGCGAGLGCVLGGASAAIVRRLRFQGAVRRVECARKDADAELERAKKASTAAEEKIRAQTDASIAQIRAQVSALQKARQQIEKSMRSQMSDEDEKIQAQIAAVRKDAEQKTKKLEEKLAAFLKPRDESDATDFPAYRSAKSKGFKDGEKPSDSEAQAMMSEKLDSFVRSLAEHEKMLLGRLLQGQSPSQQAQIIEMFMDKSARQDIFDKLLRGRF